MGSFDWRNNTERLYLYSPVAKKKIDMGLSSTRDFDNPESLGNILDTVRYIGWHSCNRDYYYEHRFKTKENLLIVCVSGGGILRFREQSYKITPGSLTIFPNEADSEYFSDPDCDGWEFYWMHLCGGNSQRVLRTLYINGVYLLSGISTGRYVSVFEEILSSNLDGYRSTLFNSERISRILCLLLGDCFSQGKIPAENNDFVKGVLTYFENNYMNEISISDLAEKNYMSTENFIRVFRRYTGYSPHAYLEIFRMERAAEMLLNTNLSVKEIAGLVGYRSVSNFISAFKSKKQMTPKRYRSELV